MRTHHTYNDEFPLLATVLLVLCALWLTGCMFDEPKLTPEQRRAMAYDWAWNGEPPPAPYPYYYYAPSPSYPPAYNAQRRLQTTCMQYGQLGHGGMLNCW
jgi:hypothetical protein